MFCNRSAFFRHFLLLSPTIQNHHLVTDSLYDIKFSHLGMMTIHRRHTEDVNLQVRNGTGNLMTNSSSTGISRRGLLGAFAATAVVAAPTFTNAAGLLRGAGDIRRLKMYSPRTGEKLETIYWVEGEYIKDAVSEITHFMRDWRNNKVINIDMRTMDIMAAAHNLMDVSEPYMLLSGYRSPETNNMLRSKSRGVAKNSLHIKGQAADLRLGSRSVSQIARAALACHAGGVGRYSNSNFVHIDCGPVRSWGR